MRAMLLIVAIILAVANAGHTLKNRDITLPPNDVCPPCECSADSKISRTPPKVPQRKCPDCVRNRCSLNPEFAVHAPFPGDCSKFCTCAHDGPLELDCPGGLHFNEVLHVCDWPDYARCTVPGTYLGGCEHFAPFVTSKNDVESGPPN